MLRCQALLRADIYLPTEAKPLCCTNAYPWRGQVLQRSGGRVWSLLASWPGRSGDCRLSARAVGQHSSRTCRALAWLQRRAEDWHEPKRTAHRATQPGHLTAMLELPVRDKTRLAAAVAYVGL